jgi:hypothetical protein
MWNGVENVLVLSPGDSLSSKLTNLQVCFDIEQRLPLLNKHTCVRVKNWISRLHRNTSNVTWKKCRNEHAGLLLLQLSKGRLEAPFDKEPPSGPMSNLPLHLKVELVASHCPRPPPVPRILASRNSGDTSRTSQRYPRYRLLCHVAQTI